MPDSTRPDWSRQLRARLAGLRMDPEREADVVEELSQHLDERHAELRRDGASDADAQRLALEELSGHDVLAQQMQALRQARRPEPVPAGAPDTSLLGDFWHDLKYAVRSLRKQPGFALVATLTLALGIGANAAIFSLVDATLLRPLPLPEPGRVMVALESTEAAPRGGVSPLNLRDWNARSRSFERIAGIVPNVGGMVMTGADGNAETVSRQWVTAGIFDVLGLKPVVGRTFTDEDDRTRSNAVVLNETFWRARYGADRGIVGREVRLDGEMYTILGVVPSAAELIGNSNLWALASIEGAPPAARAAHFLYALGRLKPGVSHEAATAELQAIAAALADAYPDTNAGRGVHTETLHQAIVRSDLRLTSLLFLGVVALVLLICCANVANLLLARATVRTRELAIRAALGASRGRVVRQLLTESLLLAAVGCALGLALGAAALAVAPALLPEGLLPSGVALAFDARVVAFCTAAALVVGVLFGLAPAWQATGVSPARVIGSESRTATGRGGRLRGLLVIGEVATAVVLLFGAGLLLRTLLALENVDRGYRADSVLTMMVDPIGDRYPTPADLLRFFENVEREVGSLPGVAHVAWATTLPLGASSFGDAFVQVDGAAAPEAGDRPTADYQIVSASYFAALDVPLVAGRAFDRRDGPEAVPVAIVSEAFVREHLLHGAPQAQLTGEQLAAAIGRRVSVKLSDRADAATTVREIVGVARQVKARPDEREDFVQLYVPLAQSPTDDIYLLVRPESGSADALVSGVRSRIARVDTEQLVSIRDVMTLEDVASTATARHRFRAVMVATFAGLALVLAMVGVFGILAYAVQQRTRDFGVRMALGASPKEVLRLVLRSAARLLLTGAAVGVALALLLGELLASVLFGVQPLDPITFAGVAALLALAAAGAMAGPAWRASRVDPVVALRGG
ncbi:MAG TPA: ABC transporter permease [Xanthomonadales bacterium]|nr:ABC transporter permease [Xanthomonadales bacterium]